MRGYVSVGMILAAALFCFCSAAFAEISLFPFEDEQTHLMGYRSSEGAVVIEARFLAAEPFSPHGIAAVADESGWKLIDIKGATLIEPLLFDNGPDPFSEGLARFKQGEKIGFFDERGKVIIPARFDFAAPFSDGLAAFCLGCVERKDGEHSFFAGGKWGFVDKKGDIAIAPRFEEAKSFSCGKAEAMLYGRWIAIDRKGAPLK